MLLQFLNSRFFKFSGTFLFAASKDGDYCNSAVDDVTSILKLKIPN